MKNVGSREIRRVLACIMAVMVFFVVLFSAFFIVSHADHDCTGEDCPICACMQQCENILHGVGGDSMFVSIGILPIVLFTASLFVFCYFVISDTPVSAKVRMNH